MKNIWIFQRIISRLISVAEQMPLQASSDSPEFFSSSVQLTQCWLERLNCFWTLVFARLVTKL